MSKRYCILGGSCSFAVHLAKFLLDHGAEQVTSIARSWQRGTSERGNFKSKAFTLDIGHNDSRFDYSSLDIFRFPDALLANLDEIRPNVIINFAAEGESSASFDNSARYFEINCVGMVKLIDRLFDGDRSWLSRFVQISSGEVYGSADRPLREDDPLRPTSPYAASKAAFDHHLLAIARRKLGVRINIVRPSNTYCEGQQLHRFIPKAFLFGLTGKRMPLYGSGTGLKSYMHAHDLARAIYLLCEHAPLSRIYNLGPRMPTSMRDIAEMIAKQLDIPLSSLCEDMGRRRGTDARYWFDSSAAERDFGWTPQVSWDEGLRRVEAWVRQNLAELADLPTEYRAAA